MKRFDHVDRDLDLLTSQICIVACEDQLDRSNIFARDFKRDNGRIRNDILCGIFSTDGASERRGDLECLTDVDRKFSFFLVIGFDIFETQLKHSFPTRPWITRRIWVIRFAVAATVAAAVAAAAAAPTSR